MIKKITIVGIPVMLILMLSFFCLSEFSEPLYFKQWGLHEKGKGPLYYLKKTIGQERSVKNEVIVAIIDTGINIEHFEIKNAVYTNQEEIVNGIDDDMNGYIDDVNGWDFCTNSPNVNGYECTPDENNHATSIASIIVAEKNFKGIIGICSSANIKILPLKVLSGPEKKCASFETIIAAIKYAELMGVKICNMSLSTEEYSYDLENVIKESKMLFVVSGGNGMLAGENIDFNPIYPACFDAENVITVGALSKTGEKYFQSNYGNLSVDIFAPGEDIIIAMPDNKSLYVSGTSYAAPFVTGVAANLLSRDYSLKPGQVKKIILDCSKKDDSLKEYVKDGKILNLSLN